MKYYVSKVRLLEDKKIKITSVVDIQKFLKDYFKLQVLFYLIFDCLGSRYQGIVVLLQIHCHCCQRQISLDDQPNLKYMIFLSCTRIGINANLNRKQCKSNKMKVIFAL